MANRLVNATSPYLLQHADNPVDWWEWGAEAFAEAERRDVPILLSVGYAACHWCHVMAHESFEDPAVAEVVNAHFVAIKVDREERPDIDAVHMKATQALTGQGGWPMTVFLTPQGSPFFAGTYFPPEQRGGMPSFVQVAEALADAWRDRRGEVLSSAEAIVDHLAAEFEPAAGPTVDVDAAVARLVAEADTIHGGFGRAPKFPAPGVIDALLASGDPEAKQVALAALEAMARGGIHDQVGGGFHRYSVDAGWVVPHFEKMLYDNALLLGSYARGWSAATDDPARRAIFERTVRGIVAFLGDELLLPTGGFASSLDADSADIRGMMHEGIYYVWSPQLLRDALGEEDAAWAQDFFGVTEAGTFEHGLSTLQLRGDPGIERLSDVTDRLRAVRERRFAPQRDDKLVAGWNGFAIDSLVLAAQTFGEAAWLRLAELAAAATWRLWTDGVLRRAGIGGQPGEAAALAEDHGALALGFARLAAATGRPVWLDRATLLLEAADHLFSADDGGFYDAPDGGVRPYARARDTTDNPTPSGTACLVAALRLVGRLADRIDLRERADLAAGSLRAAVQQTPRFAGWALADAMVEGRVDEGLEPAVVVVVTADDDPLDSLARSAVQLGPAGTIVLAGRAGTSGFGHHFDNRVAREGFSTAYVCRGAVCFEPVTNDDQLISALWRPVR